MIVSAPEVKVKFPLPEAGQVPDTFVIFLININSPSYASGFALNEQL